MSTSQIIEKFDAITKPYKEHHCMGWGQCPEKCDKLHLYCNYELDHGIEMDELIEAVEECKKLCKQALAERDKEWLSCIPNEREAKNLSKEQLEEMKMFDLTVWNSCLSEFNQNLKDKKII